ncbi:TonB-dependent receptor [Iodidimonas muriae]|uniref:TonB-dependent receptor n=2 Tax=Iodidimonas muriae TaxID=261467 RepID=A0ABQ2LH33_9PROT|nr:TonB-dependent receptor [Iodidimonas muriae]
MAHAQEESSIETIEVTGTRSTIRNSIEVKRDSAAIVDALSADDIGDLPALSIGEALETLTGASSHREQGGATEISIRGLGPFLGSTVINGREATNGSGDRSVNFSQFPSELFNKLAIYKTQQANLIEGGVSGQIALETLKPLEYGKRRIQGEIKANYNPDNNNISPRERDFGYRGTLSYVDQFDLGSLGKFGLSIGAQRNVTTNPEQEARSTSTFRDCRNDPSRDGDGVFRDNNNCDSGGGNLDLVADENGVVPDENAPFVMAASSRSFRQNITDDDRDSVFGAFQWRPTDRWDINFDIQYSDRVFTEVRNDLVFAENRRIDEPGFVRDGKFDVPLTVGEFGSLQTFTNNQRIETNSTYQERLEEYVGGGLGLSYMLTDRLIVSLDASYSRTERRENIIQTRLQSEPVDIFGNPVPGAADNGRVETATLIGQNGSDIHNFFVRNFDVTDHDLFADAARTRVDLNQFRNNEIKAIRGDFDYETGWGLINNIEGGMRYSKLEFNSVPQIRDEFTFDDSAIAAVSQACRFGSFPESGFLTSVSGGQPLITNFDDDGNVIAEGTGNGFAAFDPLCLAEQFLGSAPQIPDPAQDIANVDVTENTIAGYMQANYAGELGDLPVRGNFGLRIVRTKVESTGLRGELFIVPGAEPGEIADIDVDTSTVTEVVGGGTYTKFLPSLNAVFDLRDDLLVRGAVYRALSRPDPDSLGFGRSFSGITDDSEGETDISNVVALATANGNPFTDPLMSWNFDAAIEWYPNDDTILAIGTYYKRFDGGFDTVGQIEEFLIDGQALQTVVTTTETTGNTSEIVGMEITAAHRFSYLPGPLSGLGAKISYNYADSNFEFEDGQFGEGVVLVDGEERRRAGIIPPAEIFGFSKHVLSAQLYYQIGRLDIQGIYKYRSEYFQQFVSTPGNLRFIGNTGVFEVRVTYDLTDNIELKFEGLNLNNEPRKQFNPTRENLAEVNVYGPRLFAGVRVKF